MKNENENPKPKKLKHDFSEFAKYIRDSRKARASQRHSNAQERSGTQTTRDTPKR
jgi:hypothetical protein